MNIQPVMRGYYVNTDEVLMVLNYGCGKRGQSGRSQAVQTGIQAITQEAMTSGRYYDFTGGDALLSVIILKNGLIIGTPYLASTLVHNRLRAVISDAAAAKRKRRKAAQT